jgi:hypothetical protein
MTTVLDIPARLDAPIACDMSTAQDTPPERVAAYGRLFERALTGRERRADGVVLTFTADAREAVEDLVHREAACCPFMGYRVDVVGDSVVWTTTNPRSEDDRAAADVLVQALYDLAGRQTTINQTR